MLSAKRDGDAIHRASNAIRQLEELLPLTEPQLRRLLETVTPNMTATTRQRVVDLLMRSDEGKAWLGEEAYHSDCVIHQRLKTFLLASRAGEVDRADHHGCQNARSRSVPWCT